MACSSRALHRLANSFLGGSSLHARLSLRPSGKGVQFKFTVARAFSVSAVRKAASETPPDTSAYLSSRFVGGKGKKVDVEKVLVVGSGGLSIGQAGEFDYSGKSMT